MKSDTSGPNKGILILLKPIDQELINTFEDTTGRHYFLLMIINYYMKVIPSLLMMKTYFHLKASIRIQTMFLQKVPSKTLTVISVVS